VVLEVGSATGRDARALEALGRRVERTDAAHAFVEMLSAQGYAARRLDVLTNDVGGPYAAVLAHAVFLHFTSRQLRTALDRVRRALAADGVPGFTVKEGNGSEERGRAGDARVLPVLATGCPPVPGRGAGLAGRGRQHRHGLDVDVDQRRGDSRLTA
jgi:hypothetical protein